MDKFAALGAFNKVVEAGSFAEAARQVGQSRSQVNRLVINLEDALGVSLLNRTTRKLTLTPTGQAFYERSKTIVSDLVEAEEMVQTVHEEPQGEIRINAPMSFGTLHLGPALVEFMKLYPRIRVQLILADRFVDPVSEGFDITTRIAEPADLPSLIDHEIVEAKRVLCASPSFIKAQGEPAFIGALKDLPCLHYGNLTTGNTWHFIGPEGEVNVSVKGVLCSNNADVLLDAAVQGLGVALLPTFIAGKELQSGRLISILQDYKAPKITLRLIYPPNRHLSTRIRLFVKFMHERFGDRPYWDLVS